MKPLKTAISLAVAGLALCACTSTGQVQVTPEMVLGAAQTAGSLYNFSFSGGDGSTLASAVIITAPNELAGINAEVNWIKINRPGWKKRKQEILAQNNRTYHHVEYRTSDNQTKSVYFDVTACMRAQ